MWSDKINEFLLDDKYGVNCGILKDTMVVAAGGDYLILTSDFLLLLTTELTLAINTFGENGFVI